MNGSCEKLDVSAIWPELIVVRAGLKYLTSLRLQWWARLGGVWYKWDSNEGVIATKGTTFRVR